MPKVDIIYMVKISELASCDIDLIIDYTIENFGTDAMIKYHESLEQCFKTIDNNPKIGLKSDYIIKDFYRFNHRSHVIFYQIFGYFYGICSSTFSQIVGNDPHIKRVW